MDIHVTIDGTVQTLHQGATLADALALYSPFGAEATVSRLNGVPHKSVDSPETIALADGDVLDVFPLVIGG